MLWKNIIEKYGEEMAQKISASKYMQGITVEFVKKDGTPASYEDVEKGDCDIDIPERDVELAYQDVMGKKIPTECWD